MDYYFPKGHGCDGKGRRPSPLSVFRGFIPFDEFDNPLSSSPAATLGPELGQT